jgi:hypothetical protein
MSLKSTFFNNVNCIKCTKQRANEHDDLIKKGGRVSNKKRARAQNRPDSPPILSKKKRKFPTKLHTRFCLESAKILKYPFYTTRLWKPRGERREKQRS